MRVSLNEIKKYVDLPNNLSDKQIAYDMTLRTVEVDEVEDVSNELIKIRFLGEIVNNKFVGGVIRKPTFNSSLRLINQEEVALILGDDTASSFIIGESPLYDSHPISVDINDLFSSHMAIFGNSGSGKSCGVARLLQNVFQNPKLLPFRSNFFIFDA